MTTTNLGRVAVVPKGTWSAGTYKALDLVRYNDASYIAKSTTTALPTDTTYWTLVVSDGATGSTGPAGPTGSTGPAGSVLSVSALTLGTTGTDLTSTVANSTSSPTITLNVPTASATNRGVLSTTDWTTFNNKQAAITFGTGVQTWIGTPSSANLAAAVTDETGSGSLVFNTTPTFIGIRETKVAMPANAIDLATGNYFTKTISGATTFTVSNVPASGTVGEFILDLTNGGSGAITWWGVKWVGGTAPTLTTAGRDTLGFFTHDGGTIWTGFVIGKDIK